MANCKECMWNKGDEHSCLVIRERFGLTGDCHPMQEAEHFERIPEVGDVMYVRGDIDFPNKDSQGVYAFDKINLSFNPSMLDRIGLPISIESVYSENKECYSSGWYWHYYWLTHKEPIQNINKQPIGPVPKSVFQESLSDYSIAKREERCIELSKAINETLNRDFNNQFITEWVVELSELITDLDGGF